MKTSFLRIGNIDYTINLHIKPVIQKISDYFLEDGKSKATLYTWSNAVFVSKEQIIIGDNDKFELIDTELREHYYFENSKIIAIPTESKPIYSISVGYCFVDKFEANLLINAQQTVK